MTRDPGGETIHLHTKDDQSDEDDKIEAVRDPVDDEGEMHLGHDLEIGAAQDLVDEDAETPLGKDLEIGLSLTEGDKSEKGPGHGVVSTELLIASGVNDQQVATEVCDGRCQGQDIPVDG